ncbi:Aste57867_258 [Aphanomyces stellatus]|uniref:Aste57867_258 protein n=1 Tax=Aphanomyces stellatus TaxID=120398 RepID=A0A485K7C1_9STRA|nr:hypothetical protein As57867_000258 [Aphanomyces stellatus]VFT77484.1 Aste57867_258 [Aphanomyces stellatus]
MVVARRGQYSDADLNHAVTRILEHKERGITVSQEAGIPYRTLMQRVRERKRGIVIEKKRRGSKPSLAFNYEQELLAWMMDMQTAGNPANRKEIIERANLLIKQLKPDATLGEGWYRRFIHRHPSLEVQTPGAVLEHAAVIHDVPPTATGVPNQHMPIIIRGYKKRAPKTPTLSSAVQDISDDVECDPSSTEVPVHGDEDQELLKRQDMEHRWQMERERLAMEKQVNERVAREAELKQRILEAQADEAELQLKVARAKARQELEKAGLPPHEIEAILLQ